MEWWNEDISEQTALQFLAECQEYTRSIIQNHHPDIKSKRFSHKIPSIESPFVPFGAVIHSSRTKTMWDSLRVIGSEAYGTHFIVATHKGIKNKEFELLASIPSTILMPMGWEDAVPHSTFMSTMSWGIDLRNVGRVRPWHSPIVSVPTPVFSGEENDNTFKYTQKGEPEFYWWDNLWRTKFNGNVNKWFDYYYEVPSFAQIKSLIVLLRVLNALSPLKRQAVVPASCIRNIEQVMPHVPWELIRHFVFDSPNEHPTMGDFNYEIPSSRSYEDFNNDKTSADEVFIMDNAKRHRWRTEVDDGMLHFLINGREVSFIGSRRNMRLKFIEDLNQLGYDTSDLNFSARMFTICNGMLPDRLNDSVNAARKKIKKLQE